LQEDNGITKCLKEFGQKTIGDGLVINASDNIYAFVLLLHQIYMQIEKQMF